MPFFHETQKQTESCVWWQQKCVFLGFLATKRKSKPKVASGGRHKAAGAAIGLSCGGCFERSAGVFADRAATDMYALGTFSEDTCPQVH